MVANAGPYMSLIVPLALLFVVLGWWTLVIVRARRKR